MYLNQDWIATHSQRATVLAHFGHGHADATFYASSIDLLIAGGDAQDITDPETGEVIFTRQEV